MDRLANESSISSEQIIKHPVGIKDNDTGLDTFDEPASNQVLPSRHRSFSTPNLVSSLNGIFSRSRTLLTSSRKGNLEEDNDGTHCSEDLRIRSFTESHRNLPSLSECQDILKIVKNEQDENQLNLMARSPPSNSIILITKDICDHDQYIEDKDDVQVYTIQQMPIPIPLPKPVSSRPIPPPRTLLALPSSEIVQITSSPECSPPAPSSTSTAITLASNTPNLNLHNKRCNTDEHARCFPT
ncbi:hypothetical protein SAMD00019534_025380 [Acytostelium subglobosum LB1]|uniref:hypothetical protein n=1 Tax=Acytostelium subglobosum LB1 TaxID=1410327 RepID=UPI0006449B88|nr:hypothetical protein SAMD00019534_025380 [Acytostelium subglobosum LB1]GAM19363.1 hypothetical protein SAMD00019534_025380 [Acytostelium subglobosum LB1]|eukprot:XP_012757290.1 hypothetical protein SAMD00019534_025380 [Acytostelium subglobosum LB1]